MRRQRWKLRKRLTLKQRKLWEDKNNYKTAWKLSQKESYEKINCNKQESGLGSKKILQENSVVNVRKDGEY